jgi:DDE superfamily endonuclease
MNGDAFLAYVEQVLAPTLIPGDIVVMDNLSAHKLPAIRQAIEAAGAKLLYLPPYLPDFNRSSSSSPSSKRCSERPPSAQSRASGTALQLFSRLSRPMNVPTTSATPDMLRSTWKPL